jgi:subtilisin family serine protease
MKRGQAIVILILLAIFVSSCENQTIQFSGLGYELGEEIEFKIRNGNSENIIIHDFTKGDYLFYPHEEDANPLTISISDQGDLLMKGADDSLSSYKIDSHNGYIVEFTEEPLAKAEKSLRGQQKTTILAEHDQFKEKFENSLEVKQEFYKGFNGIAINGINKKQLEEIKKDPSVKKVWRNKRVTAFLDESTGIIAADQMWASGHTGEGVTIAIIDTGVDYTHLDLGGCFGDGCKVVDGYDFVNYDSDPMDDHGHGTHCAGIASSIDHYQEGLIGVAPDATIYAYKVLDSEGGGYSSQVMAGIEAAMDPNGDDDFSDHVDIISMSLGAYCGVYSEDCGPNDPQSLLIDAATTVGVTSVIAAGNDYDYGSIGSPGTARSAITVGATCKEYGDGGACEEEAPIAEFSSKGPVQFGKDSLPKPDVVAPGVRICASQWEDAWHTSECKDEEHTAISGTSMATPHVAGAAALLKQSHPEWTPQEIKSALMLSATELEFHESSDYPGETPNIFFQGTGLINIPRANNMEILTNRQYLSHGFGMGEYLAVMPIVIKNIGTDPIILGISADPSKEYFDTLSGDEGNTYDILTPDTDSLTIQPGEEEIVGINVDVSGLSGLYYGNVRLNYNSSDHLIPYTISKLSHVTIGIGDGDNYGNPTSFFYLYSSNLDFGFGLGREVQTGSGYIPGNREYLAVAASSFYQDPDYLIYDSVFVGEGIETVDLMIGDANLFNIQGTSISGEELWLGEYTKQIFITNGDRHIDTSFSDPTIGDHQIYISNHPTGFPAEIDIIFRTRGVPYES